MSSAEPRPGLSTPVVLRYRDGRMLKCQANPPFSVALRTVQVVHEGNVLHVPVEELKAVFFVKALDGLGHQQVRSNETGPRSPKAGRLLEVRFYDGEILRGRCLSYSPSAPGFFLHPLDAEGNNEKIWVVATAAIHVKEIDEE